MTIHDDGNLRETVFDVEWLLSDCDIYLSQMLLESKSTNNILLQTRIFSFSKGWPNTLWFGRFWGSSSSNKMGLQPYQLKAFLRRPVFRIRPSVRPRGRLCESQVGKIATFCGKSMDLGGLPHLGNVLIVSHTNIQLPFVYQNISSSNTYVYFYQISEKKRSTSKRCLPFGPPKPMKKWRL